MPVDQQTSPPPAIALAAGVEIRRWRLADKGLIVRTVNANHAYLRNWMPWAEQPATDESIGTFLAETAAAFESAAEFGYGVFAAESELLGAGGIHRRGGADVLEIGYWIAEQHAGRGLGRAVAWALTAAAAALPGIARVEIRCDEANTRSAAIPRALGYELVEVYERPPVAPAETNRHMVWSIPADRARAAKLDLQTSLAGDSLWDQLPPRDPPTPQRREMTYDRESPRSGGGTRHGNRSIQ